VTASRIRAIVSQAPVGSRLVSGLAHGENDPPLITASVRMSQLQGIDESS